MSKKQPAVQAPAAQSRHAVLMIICLAGEYPIKSRHLLSDISDNTIRRTLYRLTESGIAIIVGRGEDKSIRLYAKTKGTNGYPKAFEYVGHLLGPESISNYLEITNDHKFSGDNQKKARRLRMAEVFVMMLRAGIETRPWMMPRIDLDNQPLMTGTGFYHSRVLKTSPGQPPEKISYARICGLLISPGGAYGVYNIHNGLIYGAMSSENKTLGMLQDVLMRCWEPPSDIKKHESWYNVTQAIAIGADITAAAKMHLNDKKIRTEYMSLVKTYRDVYFVPLDESGFFMLWMFTQNQWRTKILKCLIKPEFLRTGYDRTYDAVTDDGLDIVVWFDANMSKLLFYGQDDKDDGTVDVKKYLFLCFEWQKPLLKECLGDNVNVKTYSFERIQSVLLKT